MSGPDPAFTGGIRARAGPVLARPGVAAGVPWSAYPAHVSRTAERGRQPRPGPAQHRHAGISYVGDQVSAAQGRPAVSGGQRDQQDRGIIVEAVERHPIGAVVSLFGASLACVVGASRILFALGRSASPTAPT
jgi:hypothetical protein